LARGPITEIDADVLVVSAFQNADLTGAAKTVDEVVGGALQAAASDGAFRGHAFESEWIYPAPGVSARRVLLFGAGKPDRFDRRALHEVAGAAARQARKKAAKRICLAISGPAGESAERIVETVADGALCALTDSDLYKDKSDKGMVEE